jgi:hypothetical protein
MFKKEIGIVKESPINLNSDKEIPTVISQTKKSLMEI